MYIKENIFKSDLIKIDMINKKGLSLVVTSLIIVVLVFVSLGIVWVVVRGIVEGGVEQVDYNTKCLEINIRTKAVVNTDGTNYNITMSRTGSSTDEIGGVKLVFFNLDGETSDVIDSEGNIATLDTVTISVDGEIEDANKVEFTPYFEDASGSERLCSTLHFEF